jgi:hypothetical protein
METAPTATLLHGMGVFRYSENLFGVSAGYWRAFLAET